MGSMTNFEYMKQKIVDTVMGLDEMELLCLAEDTEMTASSTEGIFNCTTCEEEFGECDTCPCTREYSEKYLRWCKKEYHSRQSGRKCQEVNSVIRIKKTYRLGNEETQEVLKEGWSDASLHFSYYSSGEVKTISNVMVEAITETDATFRFLSDDGFVDDDREAVTILSSQFIDWKIEIADYYLENERTGEEIRAGRNDIALLALLFYCSNGKRDVITKVGIEELTDTEATFYFLDSGQTISIPIDRIIDWFC